MKILKVVINLRGEDLNAQVKVNYPRGIPVIKRISFPENKGYGTIIFGKWQSIPERIGDDNYKNILDEIDRRSKD